MLAVEGRRNRGGVAYHPNNGYGRVKDIVGAWLISRGCLSGWSV